ncbi:transcriptional regulator Ifh1p [[Candida] anglica]
MAKSPRKNFSARPSTMGGKNIAQGVAAFQRSRRFSIVDSEEEQDVDDEEEDDEEDGEEEDEEQDVEHEDVEMVEDDSSLTAVSEEDEETIQSHYMAAVTSGRKKLPARSSDWYREMDQSHRGAERAGRAGTTGRGEESDNGSRSGFNSNSSSDSEDTSVGINQIYSMVGQESDEEESSDEFSSSDDSDVDFVKLQAERKARSMKAVRAIKGVRGKRPAQGQASAQTDTQGKVQTKGQAQKKERRRSVVKPKFGRRKSEVALPDDINFTFEFEEGGVIESESEESEPETGRRANRGKTSHGVNRSIGLSGVTRKAQKSKKSSQYEENSGESENDSEESYRGGASRSSVAGDSRSSVAATSRTSGGVATSRSSVAGTSRTSEANASGSGALSEANASEFGSGFEFTEDIGEEIQFSFPETLLTFDDPLPVPKIKEEELNSDEDYEIDDNELLATLQADNDDFGVGFSHQASRHNSLGSIDEDEDPFLKEEEKFLVNEFENNGFDDDRSNLMDTFHSMTGGGAGEDAVMQYESSDEEEDEDEEDDDYDVIDFGEFAEGDEDDQDDPEDQEDHDQDDNHESKSSRLLVSRGRSGESGRRGKSSGKKNKRMLLPIGITNSDEEDDSYLWNYFFSSDGGSSNEGVDDGAEGYGEEGPSFDDSEEEVIVEELFKQMERDEKRRAAAAAAASAASAAGVSASGTGAGAGSGSGAAGSSSSGASSGVSTSGVSGARSVEDYDSGDSTDEDLSLPPTSKIKTGSQKAKEVLSSRTADYRPPVLGTWVAVDSKPFGIIDGLSTRSLLQHSKNAIPRRPRMGTGGAGGAGGAGALASVGKSPRSATGGISAGAGVGGTSDSAMGLDELLNISELDDDDENDVKIWQDFNSQKKRQVPLGAFRNKSILHQNMLHIPTPTNNNFNHTSKSNNEYNQRRYSLTREGGGADHGKSAGSGSGSGPRRNSLMSGRKNLAAGIKKTRRSSSSSASVSAAVSGGAATTPVVPSKQKRRRASIIEAVSEGFRPTRSGLFSENALADVEEVLGDDHELMALIKGL